MVNHLQLKNYSVFLQEKELVKSVTLDIAQGSLHVLMGPNGSGKSSLALSLMGCPTYQTTGIFLIDGQDISNLSVDKRAKAGLFLSFQQPCEVSGVPLSSFLQAAYEALHGSISPKELQEKVFRYLDLLELDRSFYYRNLHEGFSGGQKKKLEMLQLLLLKPKIALLDEIDSGLDVDALRVVAQAIIVARQEHPTISILMITHYQRMLQYVSVDQAHLLVDGTLIKSGGRDLIDYVEQNGYGEIAL